MASLKRFNVCLISVLLVISLLTALTATACAPKERTLKILAAPEGSKTLATYTYLGKMVYEETDIVTSALPGSERANYELLATGEADISYGNVVNLYDAYRGLTKWEGKPYPNLRSVMSHNVGSPSVIVVRGDSPIQKIEDLLGKRIALGNPGTQAEFAGITMLTHGYGITKEKNEAAGGTIVNLSYGDMKVQLVDKQVDAVSLTIALAMLDPNIAPAEALGPGVRFLIPSTEALEKVKKLYPAILITALKGGLYKNHPNDVPAICLGNCTIASAEVPDDIIYDYLTVVTKPEIRQRTQEMSGWVGFGEKEVALKYVGAIPLHPGAAKWYRDNGYDLSGLEVGK